MGKALNVIHGAGPVRKPLIPDDKITIGELHQYGTAGRRLALLASLSVDEEYSGREVS